MKGPVLIHRADVLDGLKSLFVSRPDWYLCLQAVAIQNGVDDEFDSFVTKPKVVELKKDSRR